MCIKGNVKDEGNLACDVVVVLVHVGSGIGEHPEPTRCE
jgi:hypothetical protein